MKTDCVVLFSGGIDSYIHLCWAERNFDNVTALFVDLGQRYVKREYAACCALLEHHPKILFLTQKFPLGSFEQTNGFIPSRNMYLLQLAANYSSNIVFGTLHHESAPDHRRPFLKKLMELIQTQYGKNEYVHKGRKLQLHMPFDLTKSELVNWYLQNVDLYDIVLRKTVACYQAHASCGKCRSCLNRWVAFKNNNLPDEEYPESPFYWASKKALEYMQCMSAGLIRSLRIMRYNSRYRDELYQAIEKHLYESESYTRLTAAEVRALTTQTVLYYVIGTGAM